jgi:hypothetical protein
MPLAQMFIAEAPVNNIIPLLAKRLCFKTNIFNIYKALKAMFLKIQVFGDVTLCD